MSKIKRLIKSYQTKVLTPTLKDAYSGGKHLNKQQRSGTTKSKKKRATKERSQK